MRFSTFGRVSLLTLDSCENPSENRELGKGLDDNYLDCITMSMCKKVFSRYLPKETVISENLLSGLDSGEGNEGTATLCGEQKIPLSPVLGNIISCQSVKV